MGMIFQRKPALEDRWYFEVYGDSGKLLATSEFFSEGGHRIAAAGCITGGTSTVKVKGDDAGRWYFQIFAGPGDDVIPEGARLRRTAASREPETGRRHLRRRGPDHDAGGGPPAYWAPSASSRFLVLIPATRPLGAVMLLVVLSPCRGSSGCLPAKPPTARGPAPSSPPWRASSWP
jgi:hypothetical protein